MAPERMFVPDETALEVLRLVDGARSLDAIVDDARRALRRAARVIAADVRAHAGRPRGARRAGGMTGAARPAGGADASLPAALPLLLQPGGADARRGAS